MPHPILLSRYGVGSFTMSGLISGRSLDWLRPSNRPASAIRSSRNAALSLAFLFFSSFRLTRLVLAVRFLVPDAFAVFLFLPPVRLVS